MKNTIKVTGKGKITVKPDTVRLIITQSKVEALYEAAVTESAKCKDYLTNAFSRLGFDKDSLKTLYFHIDAENEGYQDKDGCWKNRLVGYRFTHRMKLEFPRSDSLLGECLGLLSKCPDNPEFSIEYTLEDPESAKNMLLTKAVEDSKNKAELLCQAADAELGALIRIDYSWAEMEFVTRPVSPMMLRATNDSAMMSKSSVNMNIEPDDIEVSDTVTLIWEIEALTSRVF